MILKPQLFRAPQLSIQLTGIVGAILCLAMYVAVTDPFPQNPLYHDFSDQRSMLGIPHALNVASNIAFCVVGGWGCMLFIRKANSNLPGVSAMYLVFFLGVLFTGLGSAYYHWSPANTTLVWDRLPMTVAFMAFTCLVVSERYSPSLGAQLFPWFLMIGVFTVGYWAWHDDLRPYLAVQFIPILILPMIIWRYDGPGTGWLWLTILFYVIAKLLELFDGQLFQLTGEMISGHTAKHLAAAVGALMIVAKLHYSRSDRRTCTHSPRGTKSC